ncbi:MAG: hypothetical protein ACYS9X_22885, partial [Planctomycetota bacterium]
QNSQQGGGSGEGQKEAKPVGDLAGFDKAIAGIDQADWAKLPHRVRQSIKSGGVERFAEEHQEAIRAYFKRLLEEK